MRLGAAKQFVEQDWKRRWSYVLLGEPHVPGWIRLQHVLRELRRLGLDRSPIRFLDAGCSRGDLITYLAERHPQWSFVGLELEPDRVEKAETIRRRMSLTNVSYLRADICRLPFQNEFDLVVCSDVMEHIASDQEAFASLTRALKPGGHLIVTSPSSPQPRHLPLVAWRERLVGFDPSEIGHVRQGYSIQGLHQLFEATGSKPQRIRYTYGRWGTLCFDLFFSIGDNRPNPLLFLGLYPFLKLLGWLDLRNEPAHGAAILGVAQKLTNGQE
jgi:SAM-dependent methyltransferase